MLGLSVRQVKRLVCRYRAHGAAGLASARRGRTPNNALDPVFKQRVLDLYRAQYDDFGPTFAAEKLRERDGLEISRETLRGWLITENLWKPAKRRARPRPPRARRQCFGELVQIDGSPHNWFEQRGPRCTLLLAIDDATGRVGRMPREPHQAHGKAGSPADDTQNRPTAAVPLLLAAASAPR